MAYFGVVRRNHRVIGFQPNWGAALSPLYNWQRFYEDAVLETDRGRLSVLIRAAHAAIDTRMEQLKEHYKASAEELQVLEDALAGL
jgi:hypothetical protein